MFGAGTTLGEPLQIIGVLQCSDYGKAETATSYPGTSGATALWLELYGDQGKRNQKQAVDCVITSEFLVLGYRHEFRSKIPK